MTQAIQPFTNIFNIPGQIISSILNDPYSAAGHISVTSMISPFRLVQLRKRYHDRIEEDISEQMWRLLGQIGHKILERSDDMGAIHEERLEIEVNGWILSGQTDCYVTHDYSYKTAEGRMTQELIEIPPTVRDYKFTSVFATHFPKPEWDAQINAYVHMWRTYGYPVERGEIITIFRDWKKMDSIRKESYPPPILKKPVELWKPARIIRFISDRIAGHQRAENLADDELPLCSPEEQWRREPKYAVMKKNRKSAVRLFDNPDQAEELASTLGRDARVEYRPAEPMRCNYFCPVSRFCNQYEQEKACER